MVVIEEGDPIALTLLSTGVVRKALQTIAADQLSWTAVENGTNWLYTVTDDVKLYVVATGGEGYNGPSVGTVLSLYDSTAYSDVSYTWYYNDIAAGLLRHIASPLVGSAGTGDYPMTLTPPEWSEGAVGSLVLDWVPVTHRVRIATEPTVSILAGEAIDDHNTDGTAHADIRALIGGTSGSIVKPIIAEDATVTITSTQVVYWIDTATAVTLTNDLSALALTSAQEAAWSVALNLTDWPATSTVFAANIEWDQEPELTVTGCYRFAFSSSGGAVQGRQTFPKVYAWDFNSTWEGTASRASGAMAGVFDAVADIMVFQMPNIPLLIKPLYSLYTLRPVPENGMQIKIGLANSSDAKPDYTLSPIIITNRLVPGNGNQMFFSAIPKNEKLLPYGIGRLPNSMYLTFYAGTTNATWTPGPLLHGFEWRQQNTLEVNAYEAGWRP